MRKNSDGIQDNCPLQAMISSGLPAGRDEEKGLSFIVRAKRALKSRLSVRAQKKIKGAIGATLDRLSGRTRVKAPEDSADAPLPPHLMAGDMVRVRSKDEIEATLDHWRSFKGCAFLDEMVGYCGTNQRVLKRVERFIDERDYRLKRASGVVLLEGVICSGTRTTGRCDRACFFFWREEWLDKITRPEGDG
jgi:hypothetical protein